jgi:hypothetical protein
VARTLFLVREELHEQTIQRAGETQAGETKAEKKEKRGESKPAEALNEKNK